MIVVEDIVDPESDTTSTKTLVTNSDRIPRYFEQLIIASTITSALTFTFVLIDVVPASPKDGVATILAFCLLLPHHGASILFQWLHRHQTASIFPFTPSSLRAIAYNIVLVLLWVISTALAAVRLHTQMMGSQKWCFNPSTATLRACGWWTPSVSGYWPSIASVVTSVLELLLIIAIALVCWLHRRSKFHSHTPPRNSSPPIESKMAQHSGF